MIENVENKLKNLNHLFAKFEREEAKLKALLNKLEDLEKELT